MGFAVGKFAISMAPILGATVLISSVAIFAQEAKPPDKPSGPVAGTPGNTPKGPVAGAPGHSGAKPGGAAGTPGRSATGIPGKPAVGGAATHTRANGAGATSKST